MFTRIATIACLGFALCTTYIGTASAQSSAAPTCAPTPYNVKGLVELNPACKYTTDKKIHFVTSNSTLDCKGATITFTRPSNRPVRIYSKDQTKPIDNVTIRNCKFVGGGIDIAVNERSKTKLQDFPINTKPADGRKFSPTNVKIENVELLNPIGFPFYINSYVTGVNINKLKIIKAPGGCMYLDAHSQKTTITNSVFQGCGAGKTTDGKQFYREGIAIDGSMYNTITNSVFDGNALGGIMLYKNCWEHYNTTLKDTLPRLEPSSFNVIKDNTFKNMQVGIAVSSRATRNAAGMQCGDKTPYAALGKPYLFLDPAPNNTITGNTFSNVRTSIWVQDDNTTITNNTFQGGKYFLVIGTEFRSKLLNKPVLNTLVSGNTATGVKDFRQGVAVVYNSKGTVFEKNLPDSTAPTKPTKPTKPTSPTTPEEPEEPTKPSTDTKVKLFSCTADAKSPNGCNTTATCPVGYHAVAAKAACNLEFGPVTDAQFAQVKANTVAVTRKSDRVNDGLCIFGKAILKEGVQSMAAPKATDSQKYGMHCKEFDYNGPECQIRAALTCAPNAPVKKSAKADEAAEAVAPAGDPVYSYACNGGDCLKQRLGCPHGHTITGMKALCDFTDKVGDYGTFAKLPMNTINVINPEKDKGVCSIGAQSATATSTIKVPKNNRTTLFGCTAASCSIRLAFACKQI